MYYQFSLTEHEELNTPEDPCNEDKNYIYGSCIKQFITDKVGCRSRWDEWSNNNVDYCTTTEQYRWDVTFYEEENHRKILKPLFLILYFYGSVSMINSTFDNLYSSINFKNIHPIDSLLQYLKKILNFC